MFLDEIGDMPLSLQAKLLRAIENKTIQMVGDLQILKMILDLYVQLIGILKKKLKVENLELIFFLE